MKINHFFEQIENHREYGLRKTRLQSKPIIENIEIISTCNLYCSFCIEPPKRKQKFMTLDQIIKITKDNHSLLENRHVWLHHYGEPLLHPQLIEIISDLRENNVYPRLSTNATLLNPELSEQIIQSGLSEIVFSVDGTNKDSYETVRVNADYAKVLKNINYFLNLKKEMHSKEPITQVQLINLNNQEVQPFINYWLQTDVDWINIKTPSTRALQIRDKNLMNSIQNSSQYKKEFPCYWFWSSLIILSDGDVVPCCTDLKGNIVLGNVFDQKLEDIWNNNQIKTIRYEQASNNYVQSPVCASCPEKRGYSISFEEKLEQEKVKSYSGETIKFNSHMLIKNEKN